MPKLPVVSAKEVLKVASKLGFHPVRQTGSHIILRNENMARLVIPNHKSMKPGTLLQILKTLQLTKEEFWKLL
ncbi:MAG: type II toxin-antitoxin system HicA family toxin [Candidatus Diapherotrites archaeon]|uniref:Type II toxin-antitoxin system HicA family toxin n=1 Tax=Candidatus Iainarchaeum sp. TaxID=3101447 RepID=A0A8T3YN97_9ARCH|nr:type II toxin-antitoxin system HicA family toxin [Candidatus Diapherotrites archaeon]